MRLAKSLALLNFISGYNNKYVGYSRNSKNKNAVSFRHSLLRVVTDTCWNRANLCFKTYTKIRVFSGPRNETLNRHYEGDVPYGENQ